MKKIIVLLSLFFYFLFWFYTANAWVLYQTKNNFFEINNKKVYYKNNWTDISIYDFENDDLVKKYDVLKNNAGSWVLMRDIWNWKFYFFSQHYWINSKHYYINDDFSLNEVTDKISCAAFNWSDYFVFLHNWKKKCYYTALKDAITSFNLEEYRNWFGGDAYYLPNVFYEWKQLYHYNATFFWTNKSTKIKENWFFLAYFDEYWDKFYKKIIFQNATALYLDRSYIYNLDNSRIIFSVRYMNLENSKYYIKTIVYDLDNEEKKEIESFEIPEDKKNESVYMFYNYSWVYTVRLRDKTIKRWIIKMANESTEAERSISDFIPEIKERLGILKERLEEVWQYNDEAKEFYNSINSLLMRPWLTFSIFNEKGLEFAEKVKNEKLKEIFKYFINYFNPEKKKDTLESLKLINIPLNLNWKSFTDLDNAFFIFKKNVEIPRVPETNREEKNNEKLWEVKKKLDNEKRQIENNLKEIENSLNKKNIEEKEKYLSKYVDNFLDVKEVNTNDPRKLTTTTTWRCDMFYKWSFKYSLAKKSQLFFFEVPKSNVEYFNHDVLEFVNIVVNNLVFSWVNPIINKIPLMWDVKLNLDVSMWVNINDIINFFINIINSFLLYILDALNWMVSFLWNFQTLDEWYYCFFGKVEKLKYQEYLAFDWKNSVWVFKALPDWWFIKWEQNVLDYLFLFLFSWFFFYFAFLIFNRK